MDLECFKTFDTWLCMSNMMVGWASLHFKRHIIRIDLSLLLVISSARSAKETSTGTSKTRKRLVIFSQTMRVDTTTPIKEEILHASMAQVASVVCIIKLPHLVCLIFTILLIWGILSIISDFRKRFRVLTRHKNIKITTSFFGSHVYKIFDRSRRHKKICIAETRFDCVTSRAVCYYLLFIILISYELLNNIEPWMRHGPRSEPWNNTAKKLTSYKVRPKIKRRKDSPLPLKC